jgi:hypothetical protein
MRMSHSSSMCSLASVVALLGVTVSACGQPPPSPKMSSSSSSSEGFASCPRGSSVVGGGYEIDPKVRVSGHLPTVVSSRPTETGWMVECVDTEGKTVAGCRAYVLCASVL